MVGSTSVSRLPATPGDVVLEVDRGVEVPVDDQAAGVAGEGAGGQRQFGFHRLAGRAAEASEACKCSNPNLVNRSRYSTTMTVAAGSDNTRVNLRRRPFIPDPTSGHHLTHRQTQFRRPGHHPTRLPLQILLLVGRRNPAVHHHTARRHGISSLNQDQTAHPASGYRQPLLPTPALRRLGMHTLRQRPPLRSLWGIHLNDVANVRFGWNLCGGRTPRTGARDAR
ncbi:MAG: hypothetical protein QOE61_404 [Micromonosporaceae bacterium]|nr:hypothetical protein [Micromonosporaceae bacterium]